MRREGAYTVVFILDTNLEIVRERTKKEKEKPPTERDGTRAQRKRVCLCVFLCVVPVHNKNMMLLY